MSDAYVGSDFPTTIPGSERLYTMDFVNEIAILQSTSATVAGAITAGDLVGMKFTNSGLQDGSVTVVYLVQASDTTSTIATALNALINGRQELTQIGLGSSVLGAVITVTSPPLPVTTMDSVLAPVSGNQFATETIEFARAAYAGETIQSATCTMVSFEGNLDPNAQTTVIGTASINGSQVTFLIGNLQAGTTYRVTFFAVTLSQPSIPLYSHIACALPV